MVIGNYIIFHLQRATIIIQNFDKITAFALAFYTLTNCPKGREKWI